MKSKIILDLCGGTGAWSKPYKDHGFDVRIITLPDYDVLKWRQYPDLVKVLRSNKVYGILASPPCQMFSFARNDKTAKKPRNLRQGMSIVSACLEIIWESLYHPYKVSQNSLKFWALENPEGYLRRFLGEPVLKFDPCDYLDFYTKKTHIWGMFRIHPKIKKHPDIPVSNLIMYTERYYPQLQHLIPDGYLQKTGLSKRTVIRSMTSKNFAIAFYNANSK